MHQILLTAFLFQTGEMLPPSYTYFMNLSEYLRKYSHLGIKLGEEGKHLIEQFIAGKLEMEHRKRDEKIRRLRDERNVCFVHGHRHAC